MNKDKKTRIIGDKLLDANLPKVYDTLDISALLDKTIPYVEELFPKEKLKLKMPTWKQNVSEHGTYNDYINWILLNELLHAVAAQYVIRCYGSTYINKSAAKGLEKNFLSHIHQTTTLHNEIVDYKTKGVKSTRVKISLNEMSKKRSTYKMKNYKAKITVTRLHEIGFESSDSKQALEDAKAIIVDANFSAGSHIDERMEITEVAEDKSGNAIVLKFRNSWERIR